MPRSVDLHSLRVTKRKIAPLIIKIDKILTDIFFFFLNLRGIICVDLVHEKREMNSAYLWPMNVWTR